MPTVWNHSCSDYELGYVEVDEKTAEALIKADLAQPTPLSVEAKHISSKLKPLKKTTNRKASYSNKELKTK